MPFFETTTYSLVSINEKVSALQLKKMLSQFVSKAKDIKKRIATNDLKGAIYQQSSPYSSHYHIDPRYEEFLKTLELNFFISKYSELSDLDGNLVSIYSINYGLCKKHNILWGKPAGGEYRKYFIARPFNFNSLIKEFLSNAKRIACSNPNCQKQFEIEQLSALEFNKFKCNECQSLVRIESLANDIKDIIDRIDKSKMLPEAEIKILKELQNSEDALYAKELAQEIDYSSQLIGWRGKKLDETHKLVQRVKENGKPYKYVLTEKGKTFFTGWEKIE